MKKHLCSDHYLYNRLHTYIDKHLISKGFKQGNYRGKIIMEYLCNSGAGVAISTAAWASKNTSKSSVRKHQKNGTKDSRENCQRREVWTNLGSTGFPDQKYSTCGKKIQEDLLANEMWTGRLRKNKYVREEIYWSKEIRKWRAIRAPRSWS